MKRPLFVIISDLHFTISTLDIATEALTLAQNKAHSLRVDLIIAGDLLDTKAIIRAECMNRLLSILPNGPQTFVIPGNHDLLNESSKVNSLSFLNGVDNVILFEESALITQNGTLVGLTPYGHKNLLDEETSIYVMHTGLNGAHMGHYVQDKSSVNPSDFEGLTVFSGHYHKHQTIKCGKTGSFTYCGSPYTQSFGEANDGPKGFLVVYDDGSFDHIPTNLRKHVIIELTTENLISAVYVSQAKPGDLIWFKVRGPRSGLTTEIRDELTKIYGPNFKLDLIPVDEKRIDINIHKMSPSCIFDVAVDGTSYSKSHKITLKQLARDLVE